MKQGLQLKLNQQLILTPQLQQAIRLLQLSSIELQQEINLALESNPLLTLDDTEQSLTLSGSSLDEQTHHQLELAENLSNDALSSDQYSLPIYSSLHTNRTHHHNEQQLYQPAAPQTLQDYLLWQANLHNFSEQENVIALIIIEAINDHGYLTLSLEEISDHLTELTINRKQIAEVLNQVQQFDPPGIAARTLQECLTIQLKQLPEDYAYREEALFIITHCFSALARRDLKTIAKTSHYDEKTIKQTLHLIKSLHARPGNHIVTQDTQYIIPDIFVYKQGTNWIAELNNAHLPTLKINQHYVHLLNGSKCHEQQFIRDHLQQAKWLIKSLSSRDETLLKVTQSIITYQHAFFEQGETFMKPMVLHDIAQQIAMHESTVSRATNQKYLQCAHGIFELKYFFSSHVNNDNGDETSSTAIRARIKKLIGAEDIHHPFSDSALADLLRKEGIIIARRTVAKYRESLAIPASSQRKHVPF